MEHEEHEELADELDGRVDDLARENSKLADEITQVRQDWKAKRSDPSVPGAVPPTEDESAAPDPPPSA